MKTVKQLLGFIEAYDAAEATEKKICKEIITLKFTRGTVDVQLPSKPHKHHKLRKRHTKRQLFWKNCETCWHVFSTFKEEQKYCSHLCFGRRER